MLKVEIKTPDKHFDNTDVSELFSNDMAQRDPGHKRTLKRYDAIEDWPQNYNVFVVSKGVAGLQNILSDGRRSISALFTTNDMIDGNFCENTKSGCLVALTNLEGYWLEDANCSKNESVCSNHLLTFRKNLIRQNKFMIRHCNDLGKKSAIERVAAFIFECRHRLGLRTSKLSTPLLLQRIDIADYLGLRQETLSRAMAKLERKNLIKIINGNLVEILKLNCLRQIANGASELNCVADE